MKAPSIDIRDMLIADTSLGLVYEQNLWIGKEPPKPNDTVVIFDTTSFAPWLGLTDKGYEYPSVQIRVRNLDYETGWDLIHAIMNSLHGRAQETWNGSLYTVIYCSSGPAMLDWDDSQRVRFIVNFNLQRR